MQIREEGVTNGCKYGRRVLLMGVNKGVLLMGANMGGGCY